jgi:hypothetical protein
MVMYEQLHHLADLGASENISIQIVPSRFHRGVRGPFVLATLGADGLVEAGRTRGQIQHRRLDAGTGRHASGMPVLLQMTCQPGGEPDPPGHGHAHMDETTRRVQKVVQLGGGLVTQGRAFSGHERRGP